MDALTLPPSPATALLVVDIQERLIAAMPPREASRLVACTELLLDAARLFELPVFVTEQHPRGLGATVAPVRAVLDTFAKPPRVFEKTVFNAHAADGLGEALEASGARAVIVVGMEAHVCVFQTARSLAKQGYLVQLPFDAVTSRDPACKHTALAALAAHGALVTSAETVVFDLLGDAKHPHFKALSGRVKALPIEPTAAR